MKKIILFVLLFLIIFGLGYYLSKNNHIFYSSKFTKKAFMNTKWQMSPKEVQQANKIDLDFQIFNRLFFDYYGDDDSHYPLVTRSGRYKVFEQKQSIMLWGCITNIEYVFFDEKLFEYSLSLDGHDSNKMHKSITSALTNKFGHGEIEDDKHYIHSMQWETNFEKVSYDMTEKEGDETDEKFIAYITVSYKPMLEKIRKIALKEHENLF